jgi:ketosteroid isomerase-like protein
MQLSESEEEKIKKEITQAFEGLAEAAKSFDVDKYIEFFDGEKYTSLNSDGTVIHSLKQFEDIYREGILAIERYQSLEFSNVKITVVNAETTILVNEFEAKFLLKSGDTFSTSGGGTQVWAKGKDSWKLVSVSSSLKPMINSSLVSEIPSKT